MLAVGLIKKKRHSNATGADQSPATRPRADLQEPRQQFRELAIVQPRSWKLSMRDKLSPLRFDAIVSLFQFKFGMFKHCVTRILFVQCYPVRL